MVVKIDLNTNRHSAGRDVDGDYRIVDSVEGGGESSVARLRRRQTNIDGRELRRDARKHNSVGGKLLGVDANEVRRRSSVDEVTSSSAELRGGDELLRRDGGGGAVNIVNLSLCLTEFAHNRSLVIFT